MPIYWNSSEIEEFEESLLDFERLWFVEKVMAEKSSEMEIMFALLDSYLGARERLAVLSEYAKG